MPRALPASLYDDDQRQRLRVCIGLQLQRLWHAVIFEDEIVGGEGEDRFAGFGFHQRGDEHYGRARANSILWLRSVAALLFARRVGSKASALVLRVNGWSG